MSWIFYDSTVVALSSSRQFTWLFRVIADCCSWLQDFSFAFLLIYECLLNAWLFPSHKVSSSLRNVSSTHTRAASFLPRDGKHWQLIIAEMKSSRWYVKGESAEGRNTRRKAKGKSLGEKSRKTTKDVSENFSTSRWLFLNLPPHRGRW